MHTVQTSKATKKNTAHAAKPVVRRSLGRKPVVLTPE